MNPFQLDPELIYLNHAAVAPWPGGTRDAVVAFAQQNATTGAEHYLRWLKKEQQLRQQLQQLINAPSHTDIALLKNTSEALSVVAYGLDWQAGDNIVISNQEFPSNRLVWESLQPQGVSLRQVDLNSAKSPEQALINACDRHTRLLAISSVQYGSGMALDLERLGHYCRRQQILFCVDAIQSIGAIPFDVQAIQADFVMADGHKWMLGPEGLAVFYCRRELRHQLKLYQYGWHMLDNPGDFDQTQPKISPTARRFECGSPNMLAIHALSASLELLLQQGMTQIGQQVCANSDYLMQALKQLPGIELITPHIDGHYAGIVTFKVANQDHQALYQHYMQQRLICAQRGGGIRLSAHFYSERATLDRALTIVEQSL